MMEYLNPEKIVTVFGLIGVVIAVFAETGALIFFLPGDSLLFTAGVLASQALFNVHLLFVLCVIAAILGDNLSYYLGMKYGRKVFLKYKFLKITDEHINKSEYFFHKYGKKSIVMARFMPIVRTFVPVLAGVSHMNRVDYIKYNVIGAISWVGIFVYGGYYFGSRIPDILNNIHYIVIAIIIISMLPILFEYISYKRGTRLNID